MYVVIHWESFGWPTIDLVFTKPSSKVRWSFFPPYVVEANRSHQVRFGLEAERPTAGGEKIQKPVREIRL